MIPEYVKLIILKLRQAGYSAYIVGGCVRDFLLGVPPHDWDVCTSALPDEIERVFFDLPKLGTGIRHGTVALKIQHTVVEITTFRNDGVYSDNRHPDNVTFLSNLEGDLSRRDFTINAMAMDEEEHLIDLFGGEEDLKRSIIRAVGNPTQRFREDGLRILRGLRFASRLDFEVEDTAAKAILEERALLRGISAERIFCELEGILTGPAAGRIIRAFSPVFFTVIPELASMKGFQQFNPYHDVDVWEHTLRALETSPCILTLRLALLFHDCGKPACFFRDEKGIGHFYGHPNKSRCLAEQALCRLKCNNATLDRVLYLIEKHDVWLPDTERDMRRFLLHEGVDRTRDLLIVQRCDALAHSPLGRETAIDNINRWEKLLEHVLTENPCLSLKMLKINGNDLISIGMERGPALGKLLNTILEKVAEGTLPNDRSALLEYANMHI